MGQKQNNSTMVSDFTTFLYQKGYRGKFGLSHKAGRTYTTGSLRNCLEIFLSDYEQGGRTEPHFQLETDADATGKLKCTFRLQLDEIKGFLIREMDITDKVSKDRRHYQLVNNQQVPGSQAAQGLFPKPKPWDKLLKGKLRP
jgi:hypothetical protein